LIQKNIFRIKGDKFPEALKKITCGMTTTMISRIAVAAASPYQIHFSCQWPCEHGFFADNYKGRN
jgi:hypothetical protein